MQIGVEDPGAAGSPTVVRRSELHAAVPNPFNPRTRIAFDVSGEAGAARYVHLAIYDAQGRMVRALVDGFVDAGQHSVTWDGVTVRGTGAPSGVYFAQLRTGGYTGTQKLVMLR
jgi:flagellar hook assembly protein FlgD